MHLVNLLFLFFFFFWLISSLQKKGLSQHFENCWVAPESVGIGSKILFRRFFSWCFKPPRFECQNRVAIPVPTLFKSAGIGPSAFQILFRCFYLCQDSLYENLNITYTGAFESARIGTTYASAFKSVGIGLE